MELLDHLSHDKAIPILGMLKGNSYTAQLALDVLYIQGDLSMSKNVHKSKNLDMTEIPIHRTINNKI